MKTAKAAQDIRKGMVIFYDEIAGNVQKIENTEQFNICTSRGLLPFNADDDYNEGDEVDIDYQLPKRDPLQNIMSLRLALSETKDEKQRAKIKKLMLKLMSKINA